MGNLGTETRTRTNGTEVAYRARYESLYRAAVERAANVVSTVNSNKSLPMKKVVDVFLEKRFGWMASTERQYKAALIFVFDENVATGSMSAWEARGKLIMETEPDAPDDTLYYSSRQELAAGRERVRLENARLAQHRNKMVIENRENKIRGKTSSQKAKSMNINDLDSLLSEIDKSKSIHKEDVKLWFQSTVITGLRPSEWASASFSADNGEGLMLRVVNGKNSNGRALGHTRSINLDRLSKEELSTVTKFMNVVATKSAPGQFETWAHTCRVLFYKFARRTFKGRLKIPTMYTARHMFSSNAKKRFSRAEVAALMGHASDLTAGQHYARKSSATGAVRVEPSQRDVQAVRERNPAGRAEQRSKAFKELIGRVSKKVARRMPRSGPMTP
ncbi:MAG: hypothetical protein NVSMB6_24070 [Burkholderiaceae bacterium]